MFMVIQIQYYCSQSSLIKKNVVLKNICPTLKIIIVTSEVCNPEDRMLIEKNMRCKVKK